MKTRVNNLQCGTKELLFHTAGKMVMWLALMGTVQKKTKPSNPLGRPQKGMRLTILQLSS